MVRKLINVTNKNKIKIEGMLESMCVESPDDEEVQTLKAMYESLFEQKAYASTDHNKAVDLSSHRINEVLEELKNDESIHINEGENAG